MKKATLGFHTYKKGQNLSLFISAGACIEAVICITILEKRPKWLCGTGTDVLYYWDCEKKRHLSLAQLFKKILRFIHQMIWMKWNGQIMWKGKQTFWSFHFVTILFLLSHWLLTKVSFVGIMSSKWPFLTLHMPKFLTDCDTICKSCKKKRRRV